MCADGYVEELKGQVNESLVVQALQSCRLAPANSSTNQWNTKNISLPYSVKYLDIISIIFQMEKVQYFSNKNIITLMNRKGVRGRLRINYIQ